MRPRLRLFIGEDELSENHIEPTQVSMELGEFTRILSDAAVWERTWLSDLSDEKVKISSDLYELLMVYSQMRPSA